MKNYDIIIAGGGPAGLSAAAELSSHFSVLVMERGTLGDTAATWYTYGDRVAEHGLEDAVVFRTDHLHFVAPTLHHNMMDDCVVLDHHKTLQIWIERAKQRGVDFVQAEFNDYEKTESGITVKTDQGTFKGKLLIDSTGARSKIVKKHKLVKRVDAWVIYGARIRIPAHDRPTQIEYYPLNDAENTYIGVHPYNETETNFYVFIGKNGTFGDPQQLKNRFERVLASIHPDAEILQELQGSISSGILKKYALDNVIFWGAAGFLNPDGCGMGFNEILRQLPTFVAEVTRTLKANRLDQSALKRVALSLRDIETMHFQRIIGAFSLYFIRSDGRWDGGVRWLNAMGEQSKYWMRNEMSLDWIRIATIRLHESVSLKETIKMIPPTELLFILEQLLRFSVSASIIGISKLLGIKKRSSRNG